jgi:hypothetical protein
MTPAKASLAEVQAFLAAAIPRPESLSLDPGTRARTGDLIAQGIRLSPVEQLEIYREQFWLRHVGAMAEDFATIQFLLGEDGFRSVCEAYLATHPPASFTLRDLGDRFAEFLRTTKPWADDPLLYDCARIEWAFVEAFDAPDARPLDPATILAAPEDAWGTAKIVLHPSVQLLSLSHRAHTLREEVRANKSHARPSPEPAWVVVYRGPEKLMYIDVEPIAFRLLELLAKGEPLAPAGEQVAREFPDSEASSLEAKVGVWFQAWSSYGWVREVVFAT